jgi:hypothetical protein
MAICAASARLALDTTSGLPSLPHIPDNWETLLNEEEQKENLLHVALWIVEHDLANFDMKYWHKAWETWKAPTLLSKGGYAQCGTVHCIAGFAQVMCGPFGFTLHPWIVARLLLGAEAASHFRDNNTQGLDFLKRVIAKHS